MIKQRKNKITLLKKIIKLKKNVGGYLIVLKSKKSSDVYGIFYDVFIYRKGRFVARTEIDDLDEPKKSLRIFKQITKKNDVNKIIRRYRKEHYESKFRYGQLR